MEKQETRYTWHKVFDSVTEAREQVPLRKLKQLKLDGRAICFAHTASGFFALDDTCPHLGYSLSKGTTNYLDEVICPWHSYRYSMRDGRECEFRTRKAAFHRVEVREEGVFVGIEQTAATT
ncbi:Rieske (2Fe-2S) protein [Pontibacter indicus]|uniref:Ferredoxin subunit of nitrite reductase or a ring-hydroxylating dioxygenase n=1 Tax=Pontibacter indicus TaxID=1317125 RepID=A0A1R3XQH9_9BACT|nr:Rieske 2Fe-2S domain-containing protein [Pontibacter indicus]SIT93865.1 Ferredoxin subunit of nitrite reductase or a ring-hydroxylating dioxygenase [Pontibacter indicus]